jgi:hypothetical protein
VHTVSERHVDVHLKYYDTDKVAEKEEQHDEKCIVTDSGDRECYFDKSSDEDYEAAEKLTRRSNNKENVEDNDGEHLPAGQHLLVDIERVNSDFLNSEVRLAEAMVKVVNTSKLTLLSYHCHKFILMGVSCVGILLK